MTAVVRQTIKDAAARAGAAGGGNEGLDNYLTMIAINEPAAFSKLLGKVLDAELRMKNGGTT
jgi:hypothetical protein